MHVGYFVYVYREFLFESGFRYANCITIRQLHGESFFFLLFFENISYLVYDCVLGNRRSI